MSEKKKKETMCSVVTATATTASRGPQGSSADATVAAVVDYLAATATQTAMVACNYIYYYYYNYISVFRANFFPTLLFVLFITVFHAIFFPLSNSLQIVWIMPNLYPILFNLVDEKTKGFLKHLFSKCVEAIIFFS